MANIAGIVTENIPRTIKLGQTVFDKDGKKAGTVCLIDFDSGYFRVEENPFSERDLTVPFSLITNIDARELFLSVTKKELHRDYSNPPPRATTVAEVGRAKIATTTEPSGYDSAPIIVEQVELGELRRVIEVGDDVYTSDGIHLGAITKYDHVTGWMLVEHGPRFNKRRLAVPVTVVDDVVEDASEVYLVASEADIQRMQPTAPADVLLDDSAAQERS